MSGYVPPRGSGWERVAADAAGFDPARLAEAVAFAEASESDWPRSLMAPDGRIWMNAAMGEPLPWGAPLGPVHPRGGPSGVVLRGGRIVASWGDVARADQTFSIAKSYLALLAGLALERGLMRSLDAPVAETAIDDGFASAQNRAITWRHLLQLASEWEGTLFDRPDTVDHHRVVGLAAGEAPKGTKRALKPPGTHFEYNDVRVNRLSLSLMQLFDEELPSVLRRTIMEPIGASTSWRWEGYANSAVEVRGRRLVSVPGGTHWGGGMSISTLDHARVGLLVARDGVWGEHRVLPAGWVDELRRPSALNRGYGLLWWLNTGRAQFAAAPESSFFALGAGNHVIWIEPTRDLVVVLRWVLKTAIAEVVARFWRSLSR